MEKEIFKQLKYSQQNKGINDVSERIKILNTSIIFIVCDILFGYIYLLNNAKFIY
jgi:hypothetical protein